MSIKQHGGELKCVYHLKPAVAVSLPQKAIDALKKNPKIDYIVPDLEVFTMTETLEWGVNRIDADIVHEYHIWGTGVNVAIMDTGIDYYHPDLAANTMHVASIDMSTTTKSKGRDTYATATVTIVDATSNSAPVKGATVYGTWSGLTSDSVFGRTGRDGEVALKSDYVKNARGTFTFTVDNVAKTDWTYDSSANKETSDSITV